MLGICNDSASYTPAYPRACHSAPGFVFIVATLMGLFILYLYFFVHGIGRLRLSPMVDPNMTSVGLLVCIVIFLSEYLRNKKSLLIGGLTTQFFIFPVAIILSAVITYREQSCLAL